MPQRIIEEDFLRHICPYRFPRYKQDSHVEMDILCALPPQKYGCEPNCKFQCTKEYIKEEAEE